MQGETRGSLAAVLCALVLAGCGGGDELLTIDRVGQADAPKTLKLQINASYSPQAPTPSVAEGFRKLYLDWARQHPEWRLDLNIIGRASRRTAEQARLLERARVGQAPDCANVDSFTVPLFIEQGALKPLDEHFTKAQLDDLFPHVRKVMTGPDGHIYAWWWSTDLRVIYRNTELVPEAPKTWDELIEFAKAAEKKDPKVDGYLFNGGRWEATTFDNLGYFWMQGGELLGDEGEPVFAQGANREAMLNVFKFLRRTIDERRHAEPGHDVPDLRRDGHGGAGQVGRDVPRRLVPVADDEGAPGQGVRQVGGLRDPRARAGQDRDRHRRLGDGRLQRRPREGRGVRGHHPHDLRRRGQRADG